MLLARCARQDGDAAHVGARIARAVAASRRARSTSRGAPARPSSRRPPNGHRPRSARARAPRRTPPAAMSQRERLLDEVAETRHVRAQRRVDDLVAQLLRRRAGPDLPSRAATPPRRSDSPRRAAPSTIRPARRRARCSAAAHRRSRSGFRTPYRCSHLRIVSCGTPRALGQRSDIQGSKSRQHLDGQSSTLATVAACPRATPSTGRRARLQAIVGQRVEVESPHPARAGRARSPSGSTARCSNR